MLDHTELSTILMKVLTTVKYQANHNVTIYLAKSVSFDITLVPISIQNKLPKYNLNKGQVKSKGRSKYLNNIQ